MQRSRRPAPAYVDVQADGQVDDANSVLIVERGRAWRLADHDRCRNLNSSMQDAVVGLAPRTKARQNLRGLLGTAHANTGHGSEHVAFVDAGVGCRAARVDMCRHRTATLIHPGSPVDGQTELRLLLEIDPGSDQRRDGQDRHQSVR